MIVVRARTHERIQEKKTKTTNVWGIRSARIIHSRSFFFFLYFTLLFFIFLLLFLIFLFLCASNASNSLSLSLLLQLEYLLCDHCFDRKLCARRYNALRLLRCIVLCAKSRGANRMVTRSRGLQHWCLIITVRFEAHISNILMCSHRSRHAAVTAAWPIG